jgi:putative exosortase-associated protein (TIGR04073 family)
MPNKVPLFVVFAATAVLAAGCAGPEAKLGRGMSNTAELVRGGEFRRSIEQTTLFDSPDAGATTGVVRGMDRTLARAGLGLYEMVTFPIPPYHPIMTDYMSPGTVYPDSYVPRRMSDSLMATDSEIGFDGGDVLPFFPGSRFRIFDGF